MFAVPTVWDRDRCLPCKHYGIAIDVCRANSMGSRSMFAVPTIWDRDGGVLCQQYGIAIELKCAYAQMLTTPSLRDG